MQKFVSTQLASIVDVMSKSLEETKAVDVNVLNLEGKGLITDALIIVNGTSNVHMQAIATKISQRLKENKINNTIEGLNSDIWVLVDCGDVVLHIFSEDSRDFYALDKLWTDLEQTA